MKTEINKQPDEKLALDNKNIELNEQEDKETEK